MGRFEVLYTHLHTHTLTLKVSVFVLFGILLQVYIKYLLLAKYLLVVMKDASKAKKFSKQIYK